MPIATTLSTICTYAGPPALPIPRTGVYSPVQLPGNRRQKHLRRRVPLPGSPRGHHRAGLPPHQPARREVRSARAAGGLDDLGDDDLGDPTCVLLAGVAVLAKFGAHVAGHDVG